MYSEPQVRVLTWGFAKPRDLERELLQHQRQHRQQERLADTLHAGLHLPLADFVHAGDVVDALDAVEVALVHAVDAHEAGAPVGAGGLAQTDGVAHRAGLDKAHPARLVVGALAQLVQVRDRQLGQAFIARVAIDGVGALQQVRNGRAAHVFMGPIHLYQQRHVGRRVLACEGRGWGAVAQALRHLREPVERPARD